MPARQATRCFVDSNIWLYALLAPDDATKSIAARRLLQSEGAIVSPQVIHEVCSNLLKKAGFSEERVRDVILAFFERQVVFDLTVAELIAASQLREQLSLSYWDSLIVAAALASGAEVLYSEDMQHGLVVNGRLMIVNPFHGTDADARDD